jgi:TrwC relaxase
MLVLYPRTSPSLDYFERDPAWEIAHVREGGPRWTVRGQEAPVDGLFVGTPRSRYVGYDLVVAAPRMTSILLAVGSQDEARSLVALHRHAVGEAVTYLETRALVWHRTTLGDRTTYPGRFDRVTSYTPTAQIEPVSPTCTITFFSPPALGASLGLWMPKSCAHISRPPTRSTAPRFVTASRPRLVACRGERSGARNTCWVWMRRFGVVGRGEVTNGLQSGLGAPASCRSVGDERPPRSHPSSPWNRPRLGRGEAMTWGRPWPIDTRSDVLTRWPRWRMVPRWAFVVRRWTKSSTARFLSGVTLGASPDRCSPRPASCTSLVNWNEVSCAITAGSVRGRGRARSEGLDEMA